jgi:hypothetical protein
MSDLDALTFEIMNAMADDWESIYQIESQVSRYRGHVGWSAILLQLQWLYEAKYVQARDEKGSQLNAFPESPEAAWFFMTELGRGVWNDHSMKEG